MKLLVVLLLIEWYGVQSLPQQTRRCKMKNNLCGTNAVCTGFTCSCPPGYTGNPRDSCRKVQQECSSHGDCDQDQTCLKKVCVNVCSQRGICGANANCRAVNHQPVCVCQEGYSGSPPGNCTKADGICSPNPCGEKANCALGKDGQGYERAVCTCPSGYIGNPLVSCQQNVECRNPDDCPDNLTCIDSRCEDPCSGKTCGTNADCEVVNHKDECFCSPGYYGDPDVSCINCEEHTDCEDDESCFEGSCVNPCLGACGVRAICKVKEHKPICSCPTGYTGHPFESCRPQDCEEHTDCEDDESCFEGSCINPCVGACGVGAICKVEEHKPICFCPIGYTGHPFESCRPFTETPEGCEEHDDCENDEACSEGSCVNPCLGACGVGAICNVVNRRAVCSCPAGFTGPPYTLCSPLS